jgi:hypothetical protein
VNRRASRVFFTAPESRPTMSETLPKAGEGRPIPVSSSWRWGGGRGRATAPLKLLGALRGRGVLIWSGGKAAAAYELDIFGRGASHSANGQLEGDFAPLLRRNRRGGPPTSGRLRLEDGREIEMELVSIEAEVVEVDGPVGADLLTLAPAS